MSTKLIKGDCLEVMKSIPDGSIDAIITDPPYGTTACKWDSVIDFDLMWEQLNRIIKPNGAIVLFGSQPFTSSLIFSNFKMFKYEWIWCKNQGSNFANVKYQPMKEHENILVFGKGKITYNPIMQKRSKSSEERLKYSLSEYKGNKRDVIGKLKDNVKNMNYDKNKRNPSSYQFFNVVPRHKGTLHPTQKPIELMEYLIKTYTNKFDTVLDFTMGSGSTGVAAKNLNRNFIGIEQDEKYFNIAKKRIYEY